MIPQYNPIYSQEEKEALKAFIDTPTWFSEYKKTEEFEELIEKKTQNKYCSVVNNGTIAISIALLACGVEPYHEVIVPDLTMIATANAVKFIGAKPVFCDIETTTGCLDVEQAMRLVTDKTKAIIYVTLNGRMNLKAIELLRLFCLKNRIKLIKDDAQSLGSCDIFGRPLQIENFGDLHTLSFSPHKLISMGQGGCIVTNDDYLGEKVERLKDFGRLVGGEDYHPEFGINSKYTDLQAVLGIEQMKTLTQKINKKREIYDEYYNQLKDAIDKNQIFMFQREGGHTPWFVDAYIRQHYKTDLLEHLFNCGIQTRKMYPVISSCKFYSEFYSNTYWAGEFSDDGFWLPSSLNLTKEDISFICEKIKEYLSK